MKTKIFKYTAVIFFILAFEIIVCCAQPQNAGNTSLAPYPEKQKHAPKPLPDRIVLSWAGDPSSSQAVTWRTDTTVVNAVAQISLADANGYELKGNIVKARTTEYTSDLGKCLYHSVNFTNLLPEKLYAYRVGDGVNWSEWFQFATASAAAKPFTFIYLGDAQDDIQSLWSRVFREAFRKAPQSAFTLHAGDLINRAGRDVEWGEWFGAPGWVNAVVPVIATPGNHEYHRPKVGDKKIDSHWYAQFTFPENGPKGLEETCYYVDYQCVRIISLNSNERYEEQAAWLRKVLKNNPKSWTIVVFHYPMYSPRERNYPVLSEQWKPIFDEFGVDLVLTGHDHTYARKNDPPRQSNKSATGKDNGTGPIYIVSTSGPKLREIIRAPWMTRAADHIQLYQIITVDPWQIHFDAYTATGELYDRFSLKKREGRSNELIEILPSEYISKTE